jgi:hypothetical protein
VWVKCPPLPEDPCVEDGEAGRRQDVGQRRAYDLKPHGHLARHAGRVARVPHPSLHRVRGAMDWEFIETEQASTFFLALPLLRS